MTPSAASLPVESVPVAARRLPALAPLAAVYLIWSSTYLVMRIGIQTLPPLMMSAIRFTIAGALLFAFAAARGAPRPTLRQWVRALPVGVLLFAGGNGLVAIAETEVSSGIAALMCATMPLWTAVFASLSGERPSRREWLGIGLGMTGVAVLVSGAELSAAPVAAIALVGSPLAWALGSMISRRLSARGLAAPGLMAAATQQVAGGVALAIIGLARGEPVPTAWSAEAVWCLVYLIVLGSLVAFTAYAWLLRNVRPATATSYAFVNPGLAVFLGAALGAEQVGTATFVATPIIVAAVVLVVGGRRR